MENKLFNLEKIKDIINPIEELQGKTNRLEEISNKLEETKILIVQKFTDEMFLNQLEEMSLTLNTLNKKFMKISNMNVNKFLIFKDNLVKKYKDLFKENFTKLKLNHQLTKKIGLYLINRKEISKIIDKSSYISAITLNQWLELLDSLKKNSLFILSTRKVQIFFNTLIKKRLQIELNKIPEDIDLVLLKNFKNAYLNNPKITFKEFLLDFENKLTKEDQKVKKKLIEKNKEKEKLSKLKKKQEEQRESYQEYFNLSKKEFERRRRKKMREKLSQLSQIKKEIEISDEILDKIKKFKEKFENKFKEKYLIYNDDEKDPLELIRERKIKNVKEYKDFKNHFKD